MDKKEIRKEVTEKKNALTPEQVKEWSLQLKEKFCALEEYKDAESIYFYLTFNNEVQTGPMIEQALTDGKRVAVPVTLPSGNSFYKDGRPKADYMEFIYMTHMEDFALSSMGIPEPDQDIVNREPERIADEKKVLILMPGLAFDKNRNRIGYGGGFYDKYLSSHSATEFVKIALCFDFQIYDEIPTEPHDEKMDQILSPSYTLSR